MAANDPVDGFDELLRVMEADARVALDKILRYEEQQRRRALPFWRRWLPRIRRTSRGLR